MSKKILIVGSGNAALCAGIAALEKGAAVQIFEKADEALSGGNTKYCAGAIRFWLARQIIISDHFLRRFQRPLGSGFRKKGEEKWQND